MTTEQSISYEFDSFRLFPNERLLLRDGRPVSLTPKVFDTLLVFVANSGRLLTKEELMKLIWPTTTVEEGNLTQNIFLLRKLFGETPHDHQYFVTIPLQGYRFVAKVRLVGIQPEKQATLRPSAEVESMAVLPFKLLGTGKENSYLGVGITDAIITKLSSLRQIAVRPTTSVLRFGDTGKDPLAAGKELGVDAVLDGTVQQFGERIRLTVQLVKVATGDTMWANKFDDRFTELFEVQDSISKQVANALAMELGVEEKKSISGKYTANAEAHKLYIKGRYFWDQRTAEGLKRGIECALEANRLDPSFALAHVGVADSYTLLGEFLYMDPVEAFPKGKEAALRALQIDNTNAEAHASLAEVALFYGWNFTEAERQYQLSIALDPNYAAAYHWFAWYLMTQGRFHEATLQIKHAQKLDPGSLTVNTVLGLPHYYQRQYDQAIDQFKQTLEMDDRFPQSYYYLGSTLAQAGRYEEAIQAFERVIEQDYYQQGSALLIYSLAKGGYREKALAHLGKLTSFAANHYVSPYVLALAYVGLGDLDRALGFLEKGYRERAAWMVFLKVDLFLDELRSNPRFVKLLNLLNLKSD